MWERLLGTWVGPGGWTTVFLGGSKTIDGLFITAYDNGRLHQLRQFKPRSFGVVKSLVNVILGVGLDDVMTAVPHYVLSDAIRDEYDGDENAEAVAEMLASLSRPVKFCEWSAVDGLPF